MKILINDGISQAGKDLLVKAGFEVITDTVPQDQLISYINENKVAAILVRSATKVRKDIIDACPSIKVIGRGGVGMDNIDVDYARSKGIKVMNTPAASSVSVAELVFAHLLGLARGLHQSNRNMPLEGEKNFAKLKKSFEKGAELQGKTLGIIGFGRIGQEAAKIAIGMGMKVLAFDVIPGSRTVELDFFDGQKATFKINPVSLEELYAKSDFITLHTPFLGKALIDAEAFAKMKDGVIIANASRGGVVDEEALVAAIESGKVSAAALDVFCNEPTPSVKLLMHPDLSLTPHIGASTLDAQAKIGTELANNVIEALK